MHTQESHEQYLDINILTLFGWVLLGFRRAGPLFCLFSQMIIITVIVGFGLILDRVQGQYNEFLYPSSFFPFSHFA